MSQKPVFQGTYAEYERLPREVKQYYNPPIPTPEGYAVSKVETVSYPKQVYGVTYGTAAQPQPITAYEKVTFAPKEPQTYREQERELVVSGELKPIPSRAYSETEFGTEKPSPKMQAYIQRSQEVMREEAITGYAIVGAVTLPVLAPAVFPAYVTAKSVIIGAGLSVGISDVMSVITTGEHLTVHEAARTAFTGEVFTVAANVAIGKFVTPRVESYLFKSYRGAVEAGKLWTPTTSQKIAMALTGAKTPGLAGQIVSMPKEVGLAEFEFAISPRSSALFTPLPKAPSLAAQLVSIPYKEIMIETGKAIPVISKPLLEAQEMAWELQTTPKSSGVMLWKLTAQETQKHYVHLISYKGYTTIGPLIYEKPFSTGFLSAPSGALITTTVTRTTGKKMPYYPQIFETPKELTRTIPYTPTITEPASRAVSTAFPILTPTKLKTITKPVISPITTPHLFPVTTPKRKASEIVVPAAILDTVVGAKQKQVVTPILKMYVPTPEIPDVPFQIPKTPPWTPPTVPKTPPWTPPTTPPYLPRAGGEAGTRGFDKLWGKWFPRKHKVKPWEAQLETFGLGKAPKAFGKLGKMETPQGLGFGATKRRTRRHKRR